MPGGSAWLTRTPTLGTVPPARYWHLYREPYGATAANPRSRARFALVDAAADPHAMFYLATTFDGALWETLLRDVEPDAAGRVRLEVAALAGWRAIELTLVHPHAALLDLTQPARRHLFPLGSAPCLAVDALLRTPDHGATHPEARALRAALKHYGIDTMPALRWTSRQHSASEVYLLFEPPMQSAWFAAASAPVALDTLAGYALIETKLALHGFAWVPGDTLATPPGPPS